MTKLPSQVPSGARYVGRIIVPKIMPNGMIGTVDVWSDTVDTFISEPSNANRVLGVASHADECAPDVNGFDRVHTVAGVRERGVGLGTALYAASAIAREFRGRRGVFSIPLSQPRAQTRSMEAESVWNRLLSSTDGRPAVASREAAEIAACAFDDFTPAERKTKAWKKWDSDVDSESPFFVRREIDFLSGQSVRDRGFVVHLASVKESQGNIQKEYDAVLPQLQEVYESLPAQEKALVEEYDLQFHSGKPDLFVKWAKSRFKSSFPSYGKPLKTTPWASFTPPASDIMARTVSANAPLSSASLGMLSAMNRLGPWGL